MKEGREELSYLSPGEVALRHLRHGPPDDFPGVNLPRGRRGPTCRRPGVWGMGRPMTPVVVAVTAPGIGEQQRGRGERQGGRRRGENGQRGQTIA